MKVTLEGVKQEEIQELIAKLEAAPYPKACHIVLLKGLDANGTVASVDLRLEISPCVAGVLLSLEEYPARIDWAVSEFADLAKTKGAL